MNICDLQIGQWGIVYKIEGNKKLAKRLSALGCTEGTKVQLKRKAPLGDPVILCLRGFDLAVRKKDAENIFIEG